LFCFIRMILRRLTTWCSLEQIADLRGWVDRRCADRRFLVQDVFLFLVVRLSEFKSSVPTPHKQRMQRTIPIVLVRPPCGLAPTDCTLNEAPAQKSPIIRDPLRLQLN